MLEISLSESEVSISGTGKMLENFSAFLKKFSNSVSNEAQLASETSFDPSPYEAVAGKIKLIKSEKCQIVVVDGSLQIKGSKDFFNNLADNLPIDAQNFPYHVHYDHISFLEFLNEDSVQVVLEITGK